MKQKINIRTIYKQKVVCSFAQKGQTNWCNEQYMKQKKKLNIRTIYSAYKQKVVVNHSLQRVH